MSRLTFLHIVPVPLRNLHHISHPHHPLSRRLRQIHIHNFSTPRLRHLRFFQSLSGLSQSPTSNALPSIPYTRLPTPCYLGLRKRMRRRRSFSHRLTRGLHRLA